MKSRVRTSGKFGKPSDKVDYHIERVYVIPGIGIVVNGTLIAGTVKIGQTLLLGPTHKQGGFDPVIVKGIHQNRVEIEEAVAGQQVSFAIKTLVKKEILLRRNFRMGIVLVSTDSTPQAIFEFEAEVVILNNATTIRPNY